MMMGLLDDAMDVVSMPYFLAKRSKPYLREGMDSLQEMLPDRAEVKQYIPGEMDDYVIDKVASGYDYLKGLLGDAEPPPQTFDPTAEAMAVRDAQRAAEYDPTAEAMAVQRSPNPRKQSLEALFAKHGKKRPMVWGEAGGSPSEEYYQFIESIQPTGGTPDSMYRRMQASAPRRRPTTGMADMVERYDPSLEEYRSLRKFSPQPGANSTAVKIMDGMYRQPQGLLGGDMTPEGFAAEEMIRQPVVPGINMQELIRKMPEGDTMQDLPQYKNHWRRRFGG